MTSVEPEMAFQADPGDPFQPGSRRYQARQRLLQALETLLEEIRDHDDDDPSRPRDFPAFDDVQASYTLWISYGRDGE